MKFFDKKRNPKVPFIKVFYHLVADFLKSFKNLLIFDDLPIFLSIAGSFITSFDVKLDLKSIKLIPSPSPVPHKICLFSTNDGIGRLLKLIPPPVSPNSICK